MAFLLALLHAEATPEKVAEAAAARLDWDRLLTLAHGHGVAALAYRRWRDAAPDTIPAEVESRLRESLMRMTARQLRVTGELFRLLAGLDAAGVAAVTFKGPVLNALLYGHQALRGYNDVDVLVRPSDVAGAAAVLQSLGYCPEMELPDPANTPVTRYARQLAFARDDGMAVDLHWDLSADLFPGVLRSHDVIARAVTAEIDGRRAPAMHPEDLLLFLCFHGSKHFWSRLDWLCDVGALIERQSGLDWPRVMERASGAGWRRMVFTGLLLAHDLLGARVPLAAIEAARADGCIVAAAGRMRRHLLEGRPLERTLLGSSRLYWLMLERPSDKFRYVRGLVAVPTLAEWRTVRLPRWLHPLYYLLRPFRLMWKYAGKALPRPRK